MRVRVLAQSVSPVRRYECIREEEQLDVEWVKNAHTHLGEEREGGLKALNISARSPTTVRQALEKHSQVY